MGQDEFGPADWEGALSELLAEGRGASAELRILSLAAVREQSTPEQWARIAPRVHTAVETVLGRILGPLDKVIPAGSETYVLIIRSGDFDAASRLVKKGCDALAKLFFGSEIDGGGNVSAQVVEVLPPNSRKAPRRVSVEGDAGESAPRPAGNGGQAADVSDDLDPVQFLPVWVARLRVVSAYWCGVWIDDPVQGRRELSDSFEADATERRTVRYDVAALQSAVDGLWKLEKAGHAAVLVPPLHRRTLASRTGINAITSTAARAPGHLRRFLSFRLLDIPYDMSPLLLADRVGPVLRFCGSITVTVSGWDPMHRKVAAAPGIRAATLLLPWGRESRASMLRRLDDIVANERSRGRVVNVHGVATPEELQRCGEAGAFNLSGAAVGDPFSGLAPAFKVEQHELPVSEDMAPDLPKEG